MNKPRIKSLLLLVLGLAITTACKKKEVEPEPGTEPVSATTIHSLLANISGTYYLAQTTDLTSGSLSFTNNGTQLNADQAARIIAAGDYLYSLNYGTGILSQLQPTSGGSYVTKKEINAGLSVGTSRPRFKLADDNTLMVYNVDVSLSLIHI